MFAALAAARARGVVAGAHPGYADRATFGRVEVGLDPGGIERLVAFQTGAACGMAALAGTRIAYVKPHGALYNRAAADPAAAQAVGRAVRAVDPALTVLLLSGSAGARALTEMGLRVAAEVFADRAVQPDGHLVPRDRPGAVIRDPAAVVARVRDMLRMGTVTATDGTPLPLAMDSLCLHGDTPGAVALARAIRDGIAAEGGRVAPFAA